MAARRTAWAGCRRFGGGRGAGLIAGALLIAAATLPMALPARALQAVADPGPGHPPVGCLSDAAAGPDPSRTDGTAALQTSLGRLQAASVEKHIATLHRMLRVTPIQEPLWQNLAREMRRNVVELDHAYAQREKLHGTMSAMDDLKSYGMVQEIHAQNVRSLIGPFQALYDNFGPSQKKAADDTIRSFTDSAVKSTR